MKYTKKVNLGYVDNNGDNKIYEFEISFISNRMLKDFNEIQTKVNKVLQSWQKIKEYESKMEDVRNLKIDVSEVKKMTEEMKKESADIKGIGESDFFKMRFNLIQSILKKNGYNKNEDFNTFEFWEECVEPSSLINFLNECINKDFDNVKKKIVNG
jgi:hypothetical protein